MGIKTVECAGLEADDLIGTLSKRCEASGMDVSVISGDRDLLQLATEHVKIRIPKTKQGRTEVEDYYADDVKARYQVTPTEFIDLKALMGVPQIIFREFQVLERRQLPRLLRNTIPLKRHMSMWKN